MASISAFAQKVKKGFNPIKYPATIGEYTTYMTSRIPGSFVIKCKDLPIEVRKAIDLAEATSKKNIHNFITGVSFSSCVYDPIKKKFYAAANRESRLQERSIHGEQGALLKAETAGSKKIAFLVNIGFYFNGKEYINLEPGDLPNHPCGGCFETIIDFTDRINGRRSFSNEPFPIICVSSNKQHAFVIPHPANILPTFFLMPEKE